MRLLELELRAFGPFTNTTLDLSAGQCGLHVIYGPNEAGKSSALRAIHGLLYGIRSNTTDNFLHDNRQMRIGGRICNAAGEELAFVRRKGNRNTLLNPTMAAGAAYPDEVLTPFLKGIDRETFTRVYGIGREQLVQGGREMEALRGLVGESLFAATIGGSGLAELLRGLDAHAQSIFDPRKKNARLKTLARQHKQLTGDARRLKVSVASWQRIRSRLAAARENLETVVGRTRELSRELNRLLRIRNGLGLIGRRRQTLDEIAALGGVEVLPEHYSAEERASTQVELVQVRQRLETLKENLEGSDGLPARIDAIRIPEGLLDFAEVIEKLRNDRAIVVEAQADADDLRRELEQLGSRTNDLLRDLGEPDIETARTHWPTTEDRVVLQELASDEKYLREQPSKLREQLATAERALERCRTNLEQLGDPANIESLRETFEQARETSRVLSELTRLQLAEEAGGQRVRQLTETLGLWTGPAEEALSLPVPLMESVEVFVTRFAEHEQVGESLARERTRLVEELADTEQAIGELQSEGGIPTEAELVELRRDRDQLWQRVRDDWLRDAFGRPIGDAEELAGQFSDALGAADRISDRLRRESKRVAELGTRLARKSRVDEQLRRVDSDSETHRQQAEDLVTEWSEQWEPAGIEPLSPVEMAGWLRRLADLRAEIRELESIAIEIAQHQSDVREACRLLRRQLKAAGATSNSRMTLPELLNECQRELGAEDERAQKVSGLQAEVAALGDSVDELRAEQARAVERLCKWQGDWTTCMQKLGCEPSATAAQANARLDALQRLNDVLRQSSELDQRLEDINVRRTQFESAAARLAARFVAPSADVSAESLALELDGALQAARRDQTLLESLRASLDETTEELERQQLREAELVQGLRSLCDLAGVDDFDALSRKENESVELQKLHRRLRELDDQLIEQAAGMSVDAFIAEADEVDADELPQEIEQIRAELADLQTQRDAAVVEVNELETDAAAADGNDSVADLDQQAVGVLSAMHDEAAEYIRIRMAAAILRRQIESHRAENEDPLLQRASSLFSRMTCAEYDGLRTDYEQDQPVLVGVRPDATLVPVTGMSDGTRDQLYLALRLAYVERQLVQYEPMPFVVDDILIQFDEPRSAATLKVLAELAEQTQVIFLTHHAHLIELARRDIAGGDLFVHYLDSRQREPASPMAGPQRPR